MVKKPTNLESKEYGNWARKPERFSRNPWE